MLLDTRDAERRPDTAGREYELVVGDLLAVVEPDPMSLGIDADDIAYVVTMLASPRSIALNGDTIAAGGGVGRAIYY